MYNIDKSRVSGDTTNMLLSNISEQLAELISMQKPQKAEEESKKDITEINEIKCPKCGKTELKGKQLTKQTLSAHIRFCKGV